MRDFNKFLVAIRMMLKLDHNMHENYKLGGENFSGKFLGSETKGTMKCESKK